MSAVGLLAEDRLAPEQGHLLLAIALLWAPVCAYLIVRNRLEAPRTIVLPGVIVALSLTSLALFGPSMLEHRVTSLAAAVVSASLWSWVAWRRSREVPPPS
jgi:hypothetical protein